MANEELIKNIASGIFQRLDEIANSIDVNSVHTLQGDGTRWTIADSLESIALSLNTIAETLENWEKRANK
jgi:hypothetical protein